MTEIIQKELSYKVVGILFEVHRELGGQYQEKYYQRAVAKALQENNIPFEEQLTVDLTYKNEKIGKYYLDFLVNGVIVLELKAELNISLVSIKQVMGYLKAGKLELGIIANFRGSKLRYKRILNPKIEHSD